MALSQAVQETPQFISPVRILHEIGLKPGMSVVDYASGAGHWSLHAAKMVSPNGKVLAIENDINMLNLLQSKAETQKLNNIEVEEVELEKGASKLAKPADLVIVSNILYLIKDKQAFAEKAAKMLSPNGKLLVVEWVNRKTLFGPPQELRVNQDEAVSVFECADLEMSCSVITGPDHYGLIFTHKGVEKELCNGHN
jgi:Methylase involved in ubiquinone/menaquinone biosynthesis